MSGSLTRNIHGWHTWISTTCAREYFDVDSRIITQVLVRNHATQLRTWHGSGENKKKCPCGFAIMPVECNEAAPRRSSMCPTVNARGNKREVWRKRETSDLFRDTEMLTARKWFTTYVSRIKIMMDRMIVRMWFIPCFMLVQMDLIRHIGRSPGLPLVPLRCMRGRPSVEPLSARGIRTIS